MSLLPLSDEHLPVPSPSERAPHAEERSDHGDPDEEDLELDIPWQERCIVCGQWSGETHRFIQSH